MSPYEGTSVWLLFKVTRTNSIPQGGLFLGRNLFFIILSPSAPENEKVSRLKERSIVRWHKFSYYLFDSAPRVLSDISV